MALALQAARTVAGEVRIARPVTDPTGAVVQPLVLWLVPHYPPGVHAFDVRVTAIVKRRGSCLHLEAFCRDEAQEREVRGVNPKPQALSAGQPN